MATKALRKRVHDYVDTVDDNALKLVEVLLKELAHQSKSALSEEQQAEVLRRGQLRREGKMTTRKWQDVYKELKSGKRK